MKVASAVAAIAFTAGVIPSAIGLNDVDFSKVMLSPRFLDIVKTKISKKVLSNQNREMSNNRVMSKIGSARHNMVDKIEEVLNSKVADETLSRQSQVLSKISSAYKMLDKTEGNFVRRAQGEPSCSFCADGSMVPEEYFDKVIDDEGFTCGDIEMYLPEVLEAEGLECSDAHYLGYTTCGCPTIGDGVCTPCEDGSYIMYPERQLPDSEDTCETLALLTMVFGTMNATTCESLQLTNDVYCGCPSTQEGPCTLCADGASVPDPDKIVVTDEETGQNSTCGELESFAAAIGEEECEFAQWFGYNECGCASPPEATCTLCAYGEPIPYPDKIIVTDEETGQNSTCSELQYYAAQADEEDCPSVQWFGYDNCGCSSPPEATCTLCAYGEPIPYPDKIIATDEETGQNSTCSDMQYYAAQVDEEDCPPVQWFGYNNCGCSSPPGGISCTLCAGGEPVPDPDKVVTDEETGENSTCSEIAYSAAQVGEEDCPSVQWYGFNQCDCPSSPQVTCTLCAYGEPVPDPDKIVVIDEETGENSTCGVLEGYVATIGEENCEDAQRYGYDLCGCSSPPGGTGCTLCGDGSTVLEEFLDRFVDENTCSDLQDYGPYISEEECPQFQFNGFANCGCPTGPEPVEDGCSICPEGYDFLPDVGTGFDDKLCGDFLEPTMGISRDSDFCLDVKKTALQLGCCVSEERCPDSDYKTFEVPSKKGPIKKPCSWLNKLREEKRHDICDDTMAGELCPYACVGACSCRDRKWIKFTQKNGKKRNCFWLSKLKKKNIRNLCKWNKSVARICPDTCQGWCHF